MGMAYWSIRNPWNDIQVIDEFGNGTLDGDPTDGPSFDACGPAAIENGAAALELRKPFYQNIGASRAVMIANHQWTHNSDGTMPAVSNPRTNGCYIENVAWAMKQRGFQVTTLHPYADVVLTPQQVYDALQWKGAPAYTVFIVTDAEALAGNEHGVLGHFVGIAAYGGDKPDGSYGKVLVLNSDIAGQHGWATGQWMEIGQFCWAQPHGYATMWKPPTGGPAMITVEQTNGQVTGAHDNDHPEIRVGGGFALAIQQNHWEAGEITVPEARTDAGVAYCVIRGGAKVAMTYTAAAGVKSYGGDIVDVMQDLYFKAHAPTPEPVDNTKAKQDLIAAARSLGDAIQEVK